MFSVKASMPFLPKRERLQCSQQARLWLYLKRVAACVVAVLAPKLSWSDNTHRLAEE